MAEFVDHLWVALYAALLFVAGALGAWPLVKFRLRGAAWLPEQLFKGILRLMGPHPSILRMTVVIFSFNGLVMFVTMASGFHPAVPQVLAVWTGLNVALMAAMSTSQKDLHRITNIREGDWVPGSGLTLLCGLLVMTLELPCFWFAVAMGIRLGRQMQSNEISYGAGLEERAVVFVTVILPALFISAAAESISIRGGAAQMQQDADE